MADLAEIKQMLKEHSESSSSFQKKMIDSIARIETNYEHLQTKINTHETEIKTLNEHRNKTIAAVTVLTFLWTTLAALCVKLIK